MIPKIIHYVWVGGNPPTPLMKKCIKSWEKYLPEYEMILWNENNFDINSNQYVKEAYEAKKHAFVSDYIRLHALYEYGGIYMDTDQEVIKPLDKFLHHSFFAGFENKDNLGTGLLGSEKKNSYIKQLLDSYQNRSFIKPDSTYDLTPNPKILTDLFLKHGLKLNGLLQEFSNECVIYPIEWFSPFNYITLKIQLTKNTHAIHHYAFSWRPTPKSAFEKKEEFLIRLLGYEIAQFIIKTYGFFIKFICKTPRNNTKTKI